MLIMSFFVSIFALVFSLPPWTKKTGNVGVHDLGDDVYILFTNTARDLDGAQIWKVFFAPKLENVAAPDRLDSRFEFRIHLGHNVGKPLLATDWSDKTSD